MTRLMSSVVPLSPVKAQRCPVCGWWVGTSGVSLLSVSVCYIFMPNVVVNTILQLEKQKDSCCRSCCRHYYRFLSASDKEHGALVFTSQGQSPLKINEEISPEDIA